MDKRAGKARVGLREVGQLAEVSAATVSRVLNQPEAVRPEVRQRVLDAVQRLRYVPNAQAKALSKGAVEAVGLLISPDLAAIGDEAMMGSFLMDLSQVAVAAGCWVIPETLAVGEGGALAMPQNVSRGLVSGLLVLGYMPPRHVRAVHAWNLPVCFVGFCEGAEELPAVEHDFEAGSMEAVQYLTALGHRRIAMVLGSPDYAANRGKKAGYLAGIRHFGLDHDPALLVHVDARHQDFTGGFAATRQLLQMPNAPTAIHYANDWFAIGGLAAASERGLKVPEQLSIVGCDDSFMARQSTPALTSVQYQHRDMARRTLDILLDQMRGQRVVERRVLLRPRLVIRESCAKRSEHN